MEEAVLEEVEEEIVEIQKLNTHTNIKTNNGYKILALSDNHATIMIEANSCEKVKESSLIYDGAILSAATFSATAAINEKNMFLIGVHLDFFNPLKGDEEAITFQADARHTSSGKKVVDVVAKVNDIAFMQGEFILLKLDEKSLIK